MHTGLTHAVVASGAAGGTSITTSGNTSGAIADFFRNVWHVVADPISQAIASAPLWLQAPVVITLAMLGCGVLALAWLRIVDLTGVMAIRIGHRLRSKVDADYQPPRNLAEQEK